MVVTLPAKHSDPSLELLRPYITRTVRVLESAGVQVQQSWLDPKDPRDATIVCLILGQSRALVWDEEVGWRHGLFESGQPGVRTRLAGTTHLGGGVLPTPNEVVSRFTNGTSEPSRKYRAHTDDPERFDDQVRTLMT